ncbi:uncharacterized protein J8A68_005814 [[Candida] subhashii]|uniref:Uncharacterized protein n=1 Tax=[Candida] subhashii TaxID=561895 RepID=A0A8J5QF79_9ASCO|nr:uncharacterized protein J8A68_005814 [[Candida] subhashii]KAG7660697.1 hypothetical protein J8A68_005814 [[Candida] subhashii]
MFQIARTSRSNIKLNSLFIRYNSTNNAQQFIKKRSTFRDLMKKPIFKTLILTLIFTSVTLELVKQRKELESLTGSYTRKFSVLTNIINKLNNNETVDIVKELQFANAFTKYKYNSITDIELDEQLEAFLKLADEPEQPESQENKDIETQNDNKESSSKKPSTSDFL